jgi:hypothetical protein
MLPRVIGSTVPAASVAAYEQWPTDEGADLSGPRDTVIRQLAAGYGDLASGA